jgi:excisionase family DNA binding protein
MLNLLTLTEAAKYLGRKPNPLRKLLKRGFGPRFQRVAPGGHFYFRQEWLDEWIEQTASPAPKRKPQLPSVSQFGLDSRL